MQKKIISSILAVFCAFGLLFIGFAVGQSYTQNVAAVPSAAEPTIPSVTSPTAAISAELPIPEEAEPAADRMLKFQAVRRHKSDHFTAEEMNYQLDWGLAILYLKDVTLEINGEQVPFAEAVAEGKITTAQLFYYARVDAENGYCKVTPLSRNGLAAFVFQYPELNLWIRYDVYETPDGQLHVIDDITLYGPGAGLDSPRITYRDPVTRERLEKENWALDFEVIETSPNGITFDVIQSGKAQQIGNVYVKSCFIYGAEYTDIKKYPFMNVLITENETTTVTFDWTDFHGEMPPGEYTLEVRIDDDYVRDRPIHPLTLDYTVWQEYYIPFTIE